MAKAGLIVAMVALLVAGQLLEREFARRRHEARGEMAAAQYSELLKPLEDATLPLPPPAPDSPPNGVGPRAGTGAAPGLYVVQPGDTLARIARKVYGTEGAWRVIYDHNRATIADPTRLQVGVFLCIPPRERARGR